MPILEWARGIKPDLVKLQQDRGVPALFAAAQMCHESCFKGELSELASVAHNYAGLKWAEWEREYGCEPVTYGTWEVLDGQTVNLSAAFCRAPDWATWLRLYADLLTGSFYGGALQYRRDPFLFGYHIWQLGWATDPAYLTGLSSWMGCLWPDYADTILSGAQPERKVVPVLDAGGRQLCTGWREGDRTAVLVRDLADAQGLVTDWDQGRGAAVLRWPGGKT